ncbi:MAG: GNAT family N-acetyltransferase [Oscillospiraceae bacterium]|nr:GNAT family N-acetyltransferase [Oscillospiraceae bacterium]
MNTLTFRWLGPGDDKAACYRLRRLVFMEEQGFIDEFDSLDDVCEHLLALDGGRPVGTARLYGHGDVYHVGRICVAAARRGAGIGRALMKRAEARARERGASVLELSAQVQARAFYERCGYRAQGEAYMEEHCPHVKMTKALG